MWFFVLVLLYKVNSKSENCQSGTLTIPTSTTEIQDDEYRDCDEFTGNLIIPSTITKIGSYAFHGCSGFTGTLKIPSRVQEIGAYCFKGCTGFSSLEFDKNINIADIENSTFEKCTGFTGQLVIPNSVSYIGKFAFAFCSGFTGNLTIHSNIQIIDENAFAYCSGFNESLIIEESTRLSLKERAFYNCAGFRGDLKLYDYIVLSKEVFAFCSGFDNFINYGISIIPQEAFYCCSGFKGSLNIDNTYQRLEDYCFCGCSGFSYQLNLYSNPTYSQGAFANCTGFIQLQFWNSKSYKFDSYVFQGCSGFTGSLNLPSGSNYGSHLFEGCSGFTGVYIGEITLKPYFFACCSGIKYVSGYVSYLFPDYCYCNCTSLEGSITVNKKVESIGDGCFYNCQSFDEIIFNDGLQSIGNMAFYNCAKFSGNLTIPFEVEYIGTGAFENTHFDYIISTNPVPITCGKAFPSDQKIILPSIYYSNEYCGVKINDNPFEPVVVPTPVPVKQIIENIEFDGTNPNEQIVTKLEQLRKDHTNSEKVLLINANEIDYTSTLQDDEFILMKRNTQINFKEGKLNLIINQGKQQTIYVDSIDNFNFSCKGSGYLTFYIKENRKLDLINPIEINGTTSFTLYNNAKSLPPIFNIHSITLKNDAIFESHDDVTFQNVNVDPYSNVQLQEGDINESITIEQTGFLKFHPRNRLINDAIVNLNIYDFNRIDPFFGGDIPSFNGKLSLHKTNDDSNPILNKPYILASGNFDGHCKYWINKIDFGNSGFNRAECYDTSSKSKNLRYASDEYESIVVKKIKESKKGGLNTGGIIGIVIAVVVVVAVAIVVTIIVIRKKKADASDNESV